ncbi:MAG TPA: chemotaxis protein CheB [Xanthomonadaceae bacterium]|nr:chemotaxis protein CheB [Xanthomonadaceae bacterium]
MAEAKRVALLARPGNARERLQAALQEAGAELVLVADPTATDVEGLRAAGAQAVLVALEPQVEDALDRFDAVLGDPAITVIFDEAELAAQREGWDAARWVRHLAAKLGNREDVLPPGFQPDEVSAIESRLEADAPPPVQYRHADTDLDLSAFTTEALALADAVPHDAIEAPGADPAHDIRLGTLALTDDLGEAVPDLGDFSFDLDLSALDTASVAPPQPDPGPLSLDPIEPLEPASGQAAPAPQPAAEPVEDAGANDRFRRDLADLEARIAGMELVDTPRAKPARDHGLVLVLAGIGGPDAVRQLLGGLPANFPRAVLIQQRLDGARHDKLVRQMQRATALPVALAEDGMAVEVGHVYVLPAELGLAEGGGRFGGGADALLAHLPAADSAIVLLSGSDPAVVDAAMAHALRGALVVGQAPDGCYDPAAPAALIARGADSGAPPALAKKLAARWAA